MVIQFILKERCAFLKLTFPFVVAAVVYLFIIGTVYYPFYKNSKNSDSEEINSDELVQSKNYKNKKSSRKLPIIVLVLMSIILVSMVSWVGFTIYQQGKNVASQEKTIDTVNIDNNTYVVLKKYGDNWILKECFLADDSIYINRDTYLISDITEKEISRYTLKSSHTISESLVEDEKFDEVKGTNSIYCESDFLRLGFLLLSIRETGLLDLVFFDSAK